MNVNLMMFRERNYEAFEEIRNILIRFEIKVVRRAFKKRKLTISLPSDRNAESVVFQGDMNPILKVKGFSLAQTEKEERKS